jgi:hypothetical protein
METAIHPTEHRTTLGATSGGTALESFGGIAVAVLAILALVGVIPATLTMIAGIVFGVSLLIAGIAVAGAWSRFGSYAVSTNGDSLELGGGAGVEMLVGIATIALGVLSLVGVAPAVLLPVLVITGGAGLILAAGTTQRLNDVHLMYEGHDDRARHVAHASMTGASVAQVLGGVAAVVLGILALVAAPRANAMGFGSLDQVGMLVLGVTLAFAGGALTGKMGRMYRAS